jgi:hypothetical protein
VRLRSVVRHPSRLFGCASNTEFFLDWAVMSNLVVIAPWPLNLVRIRKLERRRRGEASYPETGNLFRILMSSASGLPFPYIIYVIVSWRQRRVVDSGGLIEQRLAPILDSRALDENLST